MGKNKKSKLTYLDKRYDVEIPVDSSEERDFYAWLAEAQNLGLVKDFQYQPPSFPLYPGATYVDPEGKTKCLFRAHVYTADFKILIPVEHKELCQYFKVPDFRCKEPGCACFWVDVKGEFARNDGQRSFTLNQKWVYDKFGVYVHKVVPVKFFDKFGVPAEAQFTPKTNKPRRIYYGKRLLSSVAKKFSAN